METETRPMITMDGRVVNAESQRPAHQTYLCTTGHLMFTRLNRKQGYMEIGRCPPNVALIPVYVWYYPLFDQLQIPATKVAIELNGVVRFEGVGRKTEAISNNTIPIEHMVIEQDTSIRFLTNNSASGLVFRVLTDADYVVGFPMYPRNDQ